MRCPWRASNLMHSVALKYLLPNTQACTELPSAATPNTVHRSQSDSQCVLPAPRNTENKECCCLLVPRGLRILPRYPKGFCGIGRLPREFTAAHLFQLCEAEVMQICRVRLSIP